MDIYQKINQSCEKYANEIAYVDSNQTEQGGTTYSELQLEIEKYIKEFNSMKLRKHAVIGINMRRNHRICSLLATISYFDFVYVPLDFNFPKKYIDIAKKQIGLDVLVTLDDNDQLQFEYIKNSNEISINPECRFIYFTSGSTGEPKGVQHGETQFLKRINWMQNEFPFEQNEKMGQRAYMSTIPSEWDIFGGFFSGKTTYFISDENLHDISLLTNFISDHSITRLTVSPTLLRLIANFDISESKLSSLKILISLGEKLNTETVELFQKKYENIKIIDDYGSTETNTALIRVIQKDTKKEYTPLPYVDMKIKEGELLLCSSGIFLGYTGEGDNDSSKLIHIGDKVYYKTGDIVTKQGEEIAIIGRKDDIVKINGKRVNTKYVESKIQQVEYILEVAVYSFETVFHEQQLGAYIVLKRSESIDEFELRKILLKYLPDFMIPTRIEIGEKIPKLANGKVDYEGLKNSVVVNKSTEMHKSQLNNKKDVLMSCIEYVLNTQLPIGWLDVPFVQLGLNSVLTMNLTKKLQEEYMEDIEASDFYSYPTPRLLIDYMLNDTPKELKVSKNEDSDSIVITGVSGVFGEYKNETELFEKISKGETCFSEDSRIGLSEEYSSKKTDLDKTNSKFGGFMNNWNKFDPNMFGITNSEAELMDPQQRVALVESVRLINNAGYGPHELKGRAVGVFMAADKSGFRTRILKKYRHTDDAVLGNIDALIPSRISYFNNFSGPSMLIDTACSSSLTALDEAVKSIKFHECDYAIVGGISIHLSKDYFVDTSRLNIFTSKSKPGAFSTNADGFLAGEGAGFVFLTRESIAISEEKRIMCKIKGIFSNQDGASNGITAPSGSAQHQLMSGVIQRAGISPDDIRYIECHGTGTKLGDLVELNALNDVFSESNHETYIGTIKNNLGHLNAAAGITGLIKSVLCLNRSVIVPTVMTMPKNELFDWERSHLKIATSNIELEKNNEPLNFMVNSYGIGGTNVSCIIEQYESQYGFKERPLLLHLEEMNTDKTDLHMTMGEENGAAKIQDDDFVIIQRVEGHTKEVDIKSLFANHLNVNISRSDIDKTLEELGLNSLKLMNLKFVLNENYQVDVSTKDLLESNSLFELLRTLKNKIVIENEDSEQSYGEDLNYDRLSDAEIIAAFERRK